MGIEEWEKHTLLADTAMSDEDHLRSILHYQQALTLSEKIGDSEDIDVEDSEVNAGENTLTSNTNGILKL